MASNLFNLDAQFHHFCIFRQHLVPISRFYENTFAINARVEFVNCSNMMTTSNFCIYLFKFILLHVLCVFYL